jgi:hypothetical protein
MNRSIISYTVSFFAYLLVQVLILKNVAFFNVAFCFFYLAFLFSLPVATNSLLVMVIGFLLGLSVDVFYDSLGLHAFATVLVAYLRNNWLAVITPQSGYDGNEVLGVKSNGIQWFLVYVFPLVLVHHIALFYLEATTFRLFWLTFLRVFLSTFFSILAILIVQFTLVNKSKV